MYNSEITTEVNLLLKKYKLKEIPIKIKILARHLGIKIFKESLPDDISGILDLRGIPVIILVNNNHRLYRQRFSIAHEIGHFCLHKPSGIHVDKQTFFRNSKSSEGLDEIEIEANKFAAELLMPTDSLINELDQFVDLIDSNDDIILKLSRKFKVSTTAMSFRLQNLGYHF
jgi:Zn-dependent peptidase ImmA (M78 family)